MGSTKGETPDPEPGTGSLHGLTSIPRFCTWTPPTLSEASEEQHAADTVRVQTGPYIFNGLQDMQNTASIGKEDHLDSFSAPL